MLATAPPAAVRRAATRVDSHHRRDSVRWPARAGQAEPVREAQVIETKTLQSVRLLVRGATGAGVLLLACTLQAQGTSPAPRPSAAPATSPAPRPSAAPATSPA